MTGLVYFIVLLAALIKNDVLWNRYSNLELTVLIAVIIGLLRIIEKQEIGVFAGKNRKQLKSVLDIIFALLLLVDFAYNLPGEPKFPMVKPATNVDTQTLVDKNIDKLRGLEDDKWKNLMSVSTSTLCRH